MSDTNSQQDQNNDSANDVELPLVQHLRELRDRLLKSLLVVVGIFASLVYFADNIYSFIAAPIKDALPEGANLVVIGLPSTISVQLKVTFWASVMIAMPIIIFQIWRFIAPALYQKEKRIVIPLFASTVVLFYSGLAFSRYVIFPLAFPFLVGFAPADAQVMPDIKEYLNLVLQLFFAFGLAFEVPVATFLLIWSGVTDSESLAKIRPYVFIGCFVIGMFLTPPDIFSQTLLALPMWLLFELGILFGRMVRPIEKEQQADAS
ncbi:twin-arginine translocase subunit TatC [Aurantivibrio infirmus]